MADKVMFVGRHNEIASLANLRHRQAASLVIIKGRRRIGKSTLVEQFAKKMPFIRLSGLAPNKQTTAQTQRDAFSGQLRKYTDLPGVTATDWTELFILLSQSITTASHVVVLLDEISWMGSKDADFSAKLKDAWDFHFSKKQNLILILCGSVSTWIEKEIIQNTAFLGRPTLTMTLDELSLDECNQFWHQTAQHISDVEKLKILSLTGGIPRYLELINPHETAEKNIQTLCFQPSSPLLHEFKHIFSDIFGKRSAVYKGIVEALVQGPLSQTALFEKIKKDKNGQMSEYLDELELAGFIRRDYIWNLKSKKKSNLSKFRLKDNYMRFYLKYMSHDIQAIEDGMYLKKSIEAFPGWNSLLGLQFECLVQNNKLKVADRLNINPNDIDKCGPYFQGQTKRHAGCQIDLLVQTNQNILYVCEIKFSKKPIGLELVSQMQLKIKNLAKPKNFTCLPVLIHVNGVTDELEDSRYFYRLLDFCQLLS